MLLMSGNVKWFARVILNSLVQYKILSHHFSNTVSCNTNTRFFISSSIFGVNVGVA